MAQIHVANGQLDQHSIEGTLLTPRFIMHTFQDSTVRYLQSRVEIQMSKGDTIEAIEILNRLGHIYSNRVDYNRAYDAFWRSIILAEAIDHMESQIDSYEGLGILYSIYERRTDALNYYLKALDLAKSFKNRNAESTSLRNIYFALAVHYRYDNQVETASRYLDSCTNLPTNDTFNNTLIKAERAYLKILTGDYHAASSELDKIHSEIAQKTPSYLVIYYSLLGDLYLAQNHYERAVNRYKQALSSAKEHLSHLNFVPDIYTNLALALTHLGQAEQSAFYLKTAFELEEWLYSSKSPNNRFLLEIKDKLREEQERQKELIREQRLKQLEQAEAIWYLKSSLLILCIVFIAFAAIVWIRKLRREHLIQKQAMEDQRRYEREKNQEVLSAKNQELTQSALQLVAKDELLSEVKTELTQIHRTNGSDQLRKLIKNIQLNKDQSWLNFETRFSEVNQDFYNRLKERFPNLKPYDLKICALIKLNFSGKEMAQLLGISPESANTSRYRLRKRLGLEKSDNLQDFLDKI